MNPGQIGHAGTSDASAMALAVAAPLDENLTVVAAARSRARQLAEDGDPDRAVAELSLSAEVSEANGDTVGAIEDLSTAVLLAPARPQQLVLMLQRAHLAIGMDHPESPAYWQEIAEFAIADGDVRVQARALYHLFRATPTDGQKYLEQAFKLDPERLAWSSLAGCLMSTLEENTEQAMTRAKQALTLAREEGDRLAEALALDSIGYNLWFEGDLESGVATLQQAIALLSVRGNPRWLMKARLNLCEMFMDNLETARAWNVACDLRRSIDQSETLPWRSSVLSQEAWILTNLGRFVEAVPLARNASLSISSEAKTGADTITWSTYAYTLLMVGDTGVEFTHALSEARKSQRDFPLPLYAVEIDFVDLRHALNQGDVAEALVASKQLERHRSVDDTSTVANHALVLARYALWLNNRKLRDRCDVILQSSNEFEATTAPRIMVALEEARATLDLFDNSDFAKLERCIQRWRSADRPFDDACASLSIAIATMRNGKRSTAAEMLTDLHGRFSSFGSLFEVEECARILHSIAPEVDQSPMRESQLLAGLSNAERDLVERNLATATFVRGKRFFDVDDESATIYFVRRGRVRLSRSGDDAKSLTISIVDAGGVFGEGALLGLPTSDVFAEAIEDGVVGVMPATTMRELMHRIPRLGMNLLELVGRRLHRSERLAEEIAYWSVRRRFAHLVLELDERYGHPTLNGGRIVNQNFTQGELAEMVGATRKAVALLIGELRTENILDTQGKRLVIMDIEKLGKIVSDGSG